MIRYLLIFGFIVSGITSHAGESPNNIWCYVSGTSPDIKIMNAAFGYGSSSGIIKFEP